MFLCVCLAALAPLVPTSPIPRADHIVVTKSTHTMTLFTHGRILRTYRVALGQAAGPKQQQNDLRTPEGHYTVDGHNPHSSCHLALHLSYPNAADRARARALHVSPGGDVEIHGIFPGIVPLGSSDHYADWTYGCLAVTNAEIEEIYRLVPDGTPVDIEP